MSAFQRIEDIEAWQKAREPTKAIYALSNDGPFARDFGLRDQISVDNVEHRGRF
jgi:hypothetical protein